MATWNDLLASAIVSMDHGHERTATEMFDRLEVIARQRATPGAARIDGAWDSFVKRLHWRGFLTGTPSELGASLREIHDLGPGFDLFDLARSIARYDVAVTHCLGLSERRLFPLLQPFAAACDCGLDHADPS